MRHMIIIRQFPQIYKTVMVLGYCKKIVSAQYFVNKLWNLIKFRICIVLNHIKECYASIFANLQQSFSL